MLGIVVVPRNAIVIQKCEELVPISDKAFLAFQSRFALVVGSFELSIEPRHSRCLRISLQKLPGNLSQIEELESDLRSQ